MCLKLGLAESKSDFGRSALTINHNDNIFATLLSYGCMCNLQSQKEMETIEIVNNNLSLCFVLAME